MKNLEALAILNSVPYLGPVKIRHLLKLFGSPLDILKLESKIIEELPGYGSRVARYWNFWEKDLGWKKEFELAELHGIQILGINEPGYPKKLLDIPDAPIILYLKGDILPCDARALAIIGTRNATRYGHEMAETMAAELAFNGYTIVSGLARGIDTTAHRSALKHGRTIAVMGSGLLNLYPRENQELAHMISQKGVLMSEFPLNTPPDRQNFPRRNRIVSGLSMGTLLIEAPEESGAMLTMHNAVSQGRRLFAIPGRANENSFKGNHLLIKNGKAQLVEGAHEIIDALENLPNIFQKPPTHSQKFVSLEPEEQNLLAQIPPRDLSFEEIIGLTKLKATQLNVLLMSLVLKNVIKEYPGKIYKKVV